MKEELKINKAKCSVDKRHLTLDCDINYYNPDTQKEEIRNYIFTYDGWSDRDISSLTVDGKNITDFTIIQVYKHCLQAYFDGDGDATVFIDRRYCHNYEYDVYYNGKHYLVDLQVKNIEE